MVCTIYGLVDPRDGQLRYVGQTVRATDVRYRQHLVRANQKKTHRDCWIFSLLSLGLKPRLVVFQELDSKDLLDRAEVFWISYFKALGCRLTNRSEGGRSNSGFVHSEETKRKMSLAKRGKKKTAVTRAKMSIAQMGNRKWANRKTFALSEETKAKLSAAHTGKTIHGSVFCLETQATYPTPTAAARALNIDLSSVYKVINGKAALAGGYTLSRLFNPTPHQAK